MSFFFAKKKFWHSTLYGVGKCKNHGIEEGREMKRGNNI